MVVKPCLDFGICWAGWWIRGGVINKKKVPYIAGGLLLNLSHLILLQRHG